VSDAYVSPHVRLARPDEFALIGELVVAAYRSVGSDHPEYEPTLRDVAGRATSSDVLVADVAGAVAGTATFVPPGGAMSEVDDPGAAMIRMLAVATAMRGHGAGEALVRECLARAQVCGAARVRLHTEPTMTAAHRLYERLGFVRDAAYDFTPVPDVNLLAYVHHLGDAAPTV
jgi:ribosomal protein S18 acetylase RimI-like enzyme